MHELSIVMSIVEIASDQLKQANASYVEEIELDIGSLSGVEQQSFDFAWSQAVKQTVLQDALRTVNLIKGLGHCLDCLTEFAMEQLYDPCPICGGHLVQILRGKELRVKSLIVN